MQAYAVSLTSLLTIASPGMTKDAMGGGCSHPLFGNPEFGAGNSPNSVAVGDLDGDLDLDLAVANFFGDDVSVLLNNGDGTFADDIRYGAGDGPRFVAVGDLDGTSTLISSCRMSSGPTSRYC